MYHYDIRDVFLGLSVCLKMEQSALEDVTFSQRGQSIDLLSI
jgi:hypothetical protein